MTTEQNRTLKALQAAIQMEIDGKECYQQASQESGNELGKKLLESLAAEEDTHRQKFVEIYDAIRARKHWPKTNFRPDGGQRLRTVFARTCAVIGVGVKPMVTELEAISVAIDKENKSFDFYTKQSKEAAYPAERDFYETVAAEEREHSLVLLDYYQYLKDPAAWFIEKEHHSLDGG